MWSLFFLSHYTWVLKLYKNIVFFYVQFVSSFVYGWNNPKTTAFQLKSSVFRIDGIFEFHSYNTVKFPFILLWTNISLHTSKVRSLRPTGFVTLTRDLTLVNYDLDKWQSTKTFYTHPLPGFLIRTKVHFKGYWPPCLINPKSVLAALSRMHSHQWIGHW